jgi:hypothetical protein
MLFFSLLQYVWVAVRPLVGVPLLVGGGGSGAFLGDGGLNYGHEPVLEVFYSLQVTKALAISPDFQLIQNPGYNHDRGPAKFVGVRVHAEF